MMILGLTVSGLLSRQSALWPTLAVLVATVQSAGLEQSSAGLAVVLLLFGQVSLPISLLIGGGWIVSLPPPGY